MRGLAALVLALGATAALAPACNDTVINRDGKDLGGFIGGDGGGVKDLSLPNGTKFGCHGFVDCYIACFDANPTGATAAGCRTMCATKSTTNAPTVFDTALGCGQEWCLSKNVSGGANYRCMLSGSSLVNLDGTPIADTDPGTGQKACGLCLNEALAKLFGDTCMNTSSVDCNPSTCTSAVNNCVNDLP